VQAHDDLDVTGRRPAPRLRTIGLRRKCLVLGDSGEQVDVEMTVLSGRNVKDRKLTRAIRSLAWVPTVRDPTRSVSVPHQQRGSALRSSRRCLSVRPASGPSTQSTMRKGNGEGCHTDSR